MQQKLVACFTIRACAMPADSSKFRLVTRSDFDGLACVVLLRHLALIDEILFVHPKDMQDAKIAIGPRHHHQPAVR
jgi:hypothetical protein